MTIIISIILLIILSTILLLLYYKKKNYLSTKYKEDYYIIHQEELEEQKKKFDEELEARRAESMSIHRAWMNARNQERLALENNLVERKEAIDEIIDQLEWRRRELEKLHEERVANEQSKIDLEISNYLEQQKILVEQKIEQEKATKQSHAVEQFELFNQQLTEKLNTKQNELNEVVGQLEDFKKRQAVINEEILRRREVEEKQDFYRVVLDEKSIDDIQCLLNIREKLNCRENLDKLIYDVYISKPVTEMVKRVLRGAAPSGIYKITRLKTGEVYVGKSVNISKRWIDHSKSAHGVGTIAHSVLHTTMRKDGIENFTFELLEEVPKDKLTEREKYWITFYQSKEYGLNERNG